MRIAVTLGTVHTHTHTHTHNTFKENKKKKKKKVGIPKGMPTFAG